MTVCMVSLRTCVRIWRDLRANVVPIFALAMVPIVGLVGAAVDYSRANSARTAMQAALDSAALMLAREVSGLPAAQLNERANAYFAAMFNRGDAKNIAIAPRLTVSGGSYTLSLSGSGLVDTTFTRVLGQTQMKISTSATVTWGFRRLEVALALDNTGSMSASGKMAALKKAVLGLLDTLEGAASKPDDIRVAIVPFDTTVRVDQKGKSAPFWVAFDDKPDEKNWSGCLADREQPHDVQDTVPTGAAETQFPAAACEDQGQLVTMQPLTGDWKALRATVNQMTPNGYTNITIGLVWAWHALTPSLPLTEAAASAPDLDKVVILLTDGDNTRNRWTGNRSLIDSRTRTACDNIKAAAIKLYTVRVIDGNASLLRDCATNPSMYFDVRRVDDLAGVFTAIAENLAALRLAR